MKIHRYIPALFQLGRQCIRLYFREVRIIPERKSQEWLHIAKTNDRQTVGHKRKDRFRFSLL